MPNAVKSFNFDRMGVKNVTILTISTDVLTIHFIAIVGQFIWSTINSLN